MTLDLTDDEARALVEHLRQVITNDPFPLSPRLAQLRAVLTKLAPDDRPEPLPAPIAGEPSWVAAKRRKGGNLR